MYRIILTSSKCHTTNTRVAWTRINILLKVLWIEKYPPIDIARNAMMLKITDLQQRTCNHHDTGSNGKMSMAAD